MAAVVRPGMTDLHRQCVGLALGVHRMAVEAVCMELEEPLLLARGPFTAVVVVVAQHGAVLAEVVQRG